jgi:hypothetical protein
MTSGKKKDEKQNRADPEWFSKTVARFFHLHNGVLPFIGSTVGFQHSPTLRPISFLLIAATAAKNSIKLTRTERKRETKRGKSMSLLNIKNCVFFATARPDRSLKGCLASAWTTAKLRIFNNLKYIPPEPNSWHAICLLYGRFSGLRLNSMRGRK